MIEEAQVKQPREAFVEAMRYFAIRYRLDKSEHSDKWVRQAVEAFADAVCAHDCCDSEGLDWPEHGSEPKPDNEGGGWRHEHAACRGALMREIFGE